MLSIVGKSIRILCLGVTLLVGCQPNKETAGKGGAVKGARAGSGDALPPALETSTGRSEEANSTKSSSQGSKKEAKRPEQGKTPQTPAPKGSERLKGGDAGNVLEQPKDLTSPWIQKSDLPQESWEQLYVNNSPVGVTHQKIMDAKTDFSRVRFQSDSTLRISRSGQLLVQTVNVSSIEDYNGELQSLKAEFKIGDSTTSTTGKVQGGFLQLEITKDGVPSAKNIPWSKDHRGPFALEQSLRRRPMVEGETRTIRYFDPVVADLVDTKLKAVGMLRTPLLDGSMLDLLEIECITRVGENGLRNIIWVDSKGISQKSYTSFLDLRSFRCTESEAKRIADAGELDLIELSSVRLTNLSKKIERPNDAKSIRFLVSMGDDPSTIFSKRTNQSVKSLRPKDAEITVYRIDSKMELPSPIEAESVPDARLVQPTSEFQSDDPLVQKLAAKFLQQARGGESAMEALNRGVFESISKKDFSKGFLSAAQVAKQLQGDCTEHAVLLAAVARSQNIPSRLACGLIHVPGSVKTVSGKSEMIQPTMAYHMWTEAWIKDRWIPFDAVTGRYPVPPDRIKIMETTIEDDNVPFALLKVLKTMRQLTIEVQEVNY